MTIEFCRGIAEVDPAEWDDLARGRPFVDHRWLRLVESVLEGYEPRYVLLREGGRLEGVAVCAVGRRFQHPGLQRLAGAALRHLPALRCGVPIAVESGLLLRPGGDASRRARALLAGIEGLAAREHAVFTKMEYLSPEASHWPALREAGYRQTGPWTDAALEGPWPSFDTYLAGLPRRKQKDVRKIRQRAQAEGIEVAPLRPTPATAPRLWELVGNVLRRHGAGERYHPDLFLRAQAIMGSDLVVLAIRRHGEIVGCNALFASGGETAAKWLGLDYERTWGTTAYLSLLLESIAQTIACGATRLRLGATALEPKRHLGAVQLPRAGAVAVRGRLLNRLAGTLLRVPELEPEGAKARAAPPVPGRSASAA
jgi:predicted N-acyltransferase